MKGNVFFEIINGENCHVENSIMDNTYKYLAGDNIMGGNYQIVIGTGFLDDENVTNLTNLRNRIYTSSAVTPVQNGNETFFTCSVDIGPNEANGNLIEIGLIKGGLLFNRAILKRQGQLDQNTNYTYKIVSALGSQRSVPSNIISGTTPPSGSNIFSNKLKWDTNLVSDNYHVYRSTDNVNYKLLASTNKNFYYDDGFTAISNSDIPSPNGTVPTVNVHPGQVLSDPVPYSIVKDSQFAAKAKIIISY